MVELARYRRELGMAPNPVQGELAPLLLPIGGSQRADPPPMHADSAVTARLTDIANSAGLAFSRGQASCPLVWLVVRINLLRTPTPTAINRFQAIAHRSPRAAPSSRIALAVCVMCRCRRAF